jgi:predicted transcriptional regulator
MESAIESLKVRLAAHKGNWRALSDKAGVPLSTLCKIAQGVHKNPRIDTVDKLIRGLNSMDGPVQ